MNKLKSNRALSFFVVFLVYAISAIIGVLTYLHLPFSLWLNLLIADCIATVATFIFSLIFKNASVYDPYWSVQPVFILFAYFFFVPFNTASLLLLVGVTIWGLRLTLNWAYTFKNLYHQDWRYTMLKEQTKAFYPIINFVGIHLVPTLVVYSCTLPAVYLLHANAQFNAFTIIFFIGVLLSVMLQGVADFQMHSFRKNKTSPFIRNGVWKYSRHPNYLAEILTWWNVGLLSVLTMHSHYFLLFGALINTCLFLFVSIPMADKRQSKKPGFSEYKKQTRMLLPIKK